jgi:hypothetical protein
VEVSYHLHEISKLLKMINHQNEKYTNDWPDLNEFRNLTQRQAIDIFSKRKVIYEISRTIDLEHNIMIDNVVISHRPSITSTAEELKNKYSSKSFTAMHIDKSPVTLPMRELLKMNTTKRMKQIYQRKKRRKELRNKNKRSIVNAINSSNIKICRIDSIDEVTKQSLMNKELYNFRWNGISKDRYFSTSSYVGGNNNVYLEFSSDDGSYKNVIQTPSLWCPSVRQAKIHFLYMAMCGWNNVTNCTDFSDVIDYFSNRNWLFED